jgi:hypothetical protein
MNPIQVAPAKVPKVKVHCRRRKPVMRISLSLSLNWLCFVRRPVTINRKPACVCRSFSSAISFLYNSLCSKKILCLPPPATSSITAAGACYFFFSNILFCTENTDTLNSSAVVVVHCSHQSNFDIKSTTICV